MDDKKSKTFCSDKLLNRIEKLEIKNRCLEFEVGKLKEALILLEAKMNKKPVNYFGYSTDSDEEEHFYLDANKNI